MAKEARKLPLRPDKLLRQVLGLHLWLPRVSTLPQGLNSAPGPQFCPRTPSLVLKSLPVLFGRKPVYRVPMMCQEQFPCQLTSSQWFVG